MTITTEAEIRSDEPTAIDDVSQLVGKRVWITTHFTRIQGTLSNYRDVFGVSIETETGETVAETTFLRSDVVDIISDGGRNVITLRR